ncbi:hypothetical protein [Agrococcus sp. Marseille-P2731]|uniref:hypothetical protein n=1 Tax=Agrococcus sp. Marseille-P2731 TaxID=1841862 RepID=UPI000930B4A0|nr:hypothetical protein [Agrococcus sp. Marseille-P2731]
MLFEDHEDDGPIPDLPTIDEVAATFPVPLVTLVPQPSIREIAVNTISSSSIDGGPTHWTNASIMYAVVRNPADLEDPGNHVELSPDQEAALANPSPRFSPHAIELMRWMRFPLAYEAVQTHVLGPDDSTLAERLALHMWNVIANTFREERHPVLFDPDSFVDPPSERDAVAASVTVDGVELPAITIDDEHVVSLGVELDDAIATVVLAKHLLPLVRVELMRRPRPDGPGVRAS